MPDPLNGGPVALRIANTVVRFASARPELALAMDDSRAAFRVPATTPAACTVACDIGPVEEPSSPLIGTRRKTWSLHAEPGGGERVCFYFQNTRGAMEPELQVTFDPGFGTARARRASPNGPGPGTWTIGYPLDEYLYCRLLARRGALLLHSASVLDSGHAYVFVGYSGAGKSTLSGLAEQAGAVVLSDDRTLVTLRDGAPYAWGTPWHGTYRRGNPAGAYIAGVFLLAHGDADRLEPLAPSEAFREILMRVLHPTLTEHEGNRTFEVLERLVAEVPVAHFAFQPTIAGYHAAREYARPSAARAGGRPTLAGRVSL